MAKTDISFNLWTEPWITLEKKGGGIAVLSIEKTLKNAHDYSAIYDSSPLAVVGIHRLLVAILQFIFDPQENNDLKKLWRTEKFPLKKITEFGEQYAHRFDLFAVKEPFMQSGDLPIQPGKGINIDSVARLTYDIPSGTYVAHYRHGNEKNTVLCPACVARYLVSIPAFASSGGAGIKPSINGVPPVYVIPGGKSLFRSLTASLLCPDYQPEIRSRKKDNVWWVHKSRIVQNQEINEVGYGHSLTFPARRIRVHPETSPTTCTCCNLNTNLSVTTVVVQMGEKRPENAAVWFDPFVAYVIPQKKTTKKAGKAITAFPIRPNYRRKAWAIWREFSSLFLLDTKVNDGGGNKIIQPTVIRQFFDLDLPQQQLLAFRCVSLMTDNKGKIFSWAEAGFDIPPMALKDENAGFEIRKATNFTNECSVELNKLISHFKRPKSRQHEIIKIRMEENYWEQLAVPFRHYILMMNAPENYDTGQRYWADLVVSQAKKVFHQAVCSIGDKAEYLKQQAITERLLNMELAKKRKEFLNE